MYSPRYVYAVFLCYIWPRYWFTSEIEERIVGRTQTQTRHVYQMQFVAQRRVFVVAIHVRVVEHFNGICRVKLPDGVTLQAVHSANIWKYVVIIIVYRSTMYSGDTVNKKVVFVVDNFRFLIEYLNTMTT